LQRLPDVAKAFVVAEIADCLDLVFGGRDLVRD
jgi:hypothetical protein